MARRSKEQLLHRHMLEIVQNQLRDGTPPETRATLDRLLAEGHSRHDALNLIASVVTAEMSAMLQSNQPFQEARFVAALRALPKLPGDELQ
jgi:hypothetical protein